MPIELLHQAPARRRHSTPLLFVHGSFCGAWVWRENFLPYFAECGYAAYALSLRGHGATPGVLWSASLADFVADVAAAVERLDRVPVLIGHSLGGMVVQKYLERERAPGAVLMGSLPPQGLLAMTVGMFLRDPWLLRQIYLAQTNFSALDYATLRSALFSEDLPEAQARRYLRRNSGESLRAIADLSALRVVEPELVRAHAPLMVLGAAQDLLVSERLVDLTARTYHTRARIIPQLAHAMMLDTRWRVAAEAIELWLAQQTR